MVIPAKQLQTITGLLNAYLFASFRDGAFDFDYDQPYENLATEVYKIPEIKEYYDDDLFHWIIEKQIERRMDAPQKLEEKAVADIIEIVLRDLLRNIADHVIVVPIPKADFREVIAFGSYLFIPHHLKRDEKIAHLAKFTRKNYEQTESILDHTEKSRSKSFLKYPLLCVREKQQSTTIHFRALNTARLAVYAITTYYYANISFENPDLYRSLASLVWIAEPSHIAILAKDEWRQRHKPLNFDPGMPFKLDWLADKNHQRKLLRFVRTLILAEKTDRLRLLFLNSLILFNEALNQNTSIATLMMMTAAESLLTQTKNEKRLRLAAILPRLVKVKGVAAADLSQTLTDLYLKRNEFVHAGKTITIMYSDKKDKNALEIAKVAVAKLLLDYPVIEQRLLKAVSSTGKPSAKDAMYQAWQSDIDTIFEDMIKGNIK